MSNWFNFGVCCYLSVVCITADARTDSRPTETVQRKFTAFNQHDVAAIKGLYAADAVLISPDYRNLAGNEAIAQAYQKIFDSVPDGQDTIQLLESAGDHVYVQFVFSGHWQGKADQPVSVRIISVFKVVGHRIVADSTYYDRKMP